MASSEIFILSISRSKLQLAKVDLTEPVKVEKILGAVWQPANLTPTLKEVKKYLSGPARILAENDLVYVLALGLSKEEPLTRERVAAAAEKIMPEPIAETAWDYKEVLETGKERIVQIVAYVGGFFERLSVSLEESGLKAEAIEPAACSLARLTSQETEPHLILQAGTFGRVVAAHRGLVFFNQTVEGLLTTAKLNKILEQIKNKYALNPSKIILSGEWPGLDLGRLGRRIEQKHLSPFVGLAFKKDIAGKDEAVLNSRPLPVTPQLRAKLAAKEALMDRPVKGVKAGPPDTESLKKTGEPVPVKLKAAETVSSPETAAVAETAEQVETASEPSASEVYVAADGAEKSGLGKTVLVAFITVLLVAALVTGGIIYTQRALTGQKEAKASPSPVMSPAASLAPSPSASPSAELDKKSLKIQVLNGSGVRGSAARMAVFLEEQGYAKAEIGNAETQDYKTTLISIKESKEEFAEIIKEDLSEKTASASAETNLSEKSSYDVVITVGRDI